MAFGIHKHVGNYFMRFRLSRRGKLILAVLVLIFIVSLAWFVQSFFRSDAYTADFRFLNTPVHSVYKALGDKIVYYNNGVIYCVSDTGATRWSYDVGENANFHTSDTHVLIWRGSSVFVLDSNGNSTYSDNLGQDIIFGRVSRQYFGVVMGNERKSRLVVSDLKGTQIDEESDAFNNSLLLDFGFFGSTGEFMWTLKLDTDSTAANTTINTFEVGKMNTGEVALGDYITYSVLYDNGNIDIINTRRMWVYDYRLSKQVRDSSLVYGWELLDSEMQLAEDGYKLFVQSGQRADSSSINALRLIAGSRDMRYTLPAAVPVAFVSGKYVYAISSNTIYKASINDTSFVSYPFANNNGVCGFVCKLNNGKVVLTDGFEVFVLRLP